MNQQQRAVMHQCAAGSLAGQMTFPQVVGALMQIGVERYHADYSRGEVTYYMPDGDSHVEPMPHAPAPTGEAFAVDEMKKTIKDIQQGKLRYTEFVHRTMAAGCVGYFVQITGQQAMYFGRKGEVHVEFFPGSKSFGMRTSECEIQKQETQK